MSEFTIFINYKHNSRELPVKCDESVKSILSKSLKLYQITKNENNCKLFYGGRNLVGRHLDMTLKELGIEAGDTIILFYDPLEFPIFIEYCGRKKKMKIKENESLKTLMTKIFDLYNITDRHYTYDKYRLMYCGIILNSGIDQLNKTLQEVDIMEDDYIILMKTIEINLG